MNKLRIVLFILTYFIFTTCDSSPNAPTNPDNPLDPNNPEYISPVIEIKGAPPEGSVYTSDTVTVRIWSNLEDVSYRYKWDEEDEWSVYMQDSLLFFSFLNEGQRTIEVQGRYDKNNDTSSVVTRSFIVNAIQGPALFIYPKRKVISTNEQFQMELWLDDSENIAGLSTQIMFAPTKLRIDNVDFLEAGRESVMLKNGGQLVIFYDIDNITGTLQIDCAVVEGDPHDISGTGIIARINFTHLSGVDAALTFSSSSFFENSAGQAVTVNNTVGSLIVVE